MSKLDNLTKSRTFSEALKNKDFAVIADWFVISVIIVGITGLVFAGIAAGLSEDGKTGVRVFALGTILAGACTICGWVLGLLFGIPRTLARPTDLVQGAPPADGGKDAPAAAARAPVSKVNTNLEDVSDWLTKTLIGVGLTQLNVLPERLWTAAGHLNSGGFKWDPFGQTLALSIILYYLPAGFWLGYIVTRTILTKLFDLFSEPGKLDDVDVVSAKGNLRLNPEGRGIEPASDREVVAADRTLAQRPVFTLNSSRDLAAWGAAQARLNNLGAGVTALEQAVRSEPTNLGYKEALATIYTAQGKQTEAESVLKNAPATEPALYWALYEAPPDGFGKAIKLGVELKNQTGTSVNVDVWLACAYGQQLAYAKKKGDETTAASARRNAIVNVEAALARDPNVKSWLRALWKPEAGAKDDDLASLGEDDKNMIRLLGP